MRRRAGALVIVDRSLLLICEHNEAYYYTPGGGLEYGESDLEALTREIHEELGLDLKSAEPFLKVNDDAKNEEVTYFLTALSGDPAPQEPETKLLWYRAGDPQNASVPLSSRVRDHVIPALTHNNLI